MQNAHNISRQNENLCLFEDAAVLTGVASAVATFTSDESGAPEWLQAYGRMIPAEVFALRDRGAIFMVNHSGGKDSQAMYAFIRKHVPDSQIMTVHANLPEVEWEGVIEHIEATIVHELHTCRSRRTLLEMIEERGMFPSPSMRQCTSDLKRGPIERTVRGLIEARITQWLGLPHGARVGADARKAALAAGMGLIVNCMGMRAQESANRSKLDALKLSVSNSKNGREWYEWLPIHAWDISQVFEMISFVGQKPHWAYEAGMSRLSCVFCIMASRADLTIAAKLNPDLYRRYVQLERSTGQVMLMPSKTHGRLTLEQVTGVDAGLGEAPKSYPIIPIKKVTGFVAEEAREAEDEVFELQFC